MRGKAVTGIWLQLIPGITPAYAGKSSAFREWQLPNQDHPRLCGEKNKVLGDVREVSGSPPPMRGKVSFKSRLAFSGRITPAYAGKSSLPT